MKYFVKFIVLLLCMIIWAGNETLAQENTSSPFQDNVQDTLLNLYEDSKSFFAVVDQSDNVQCRGDLTNRLRDTDLFTAYGNISLIDVLLSDIQETGQFLPGWSVGDLITLYRRRRMGHAVGIVSTPALSRAVNYIIDFISEISLEDIERMRGDLERAKEEWNSCIENR